MHSLLICRVGGPEIDIGRGESFGALRLSGGGALPLCLVLHLDAAARLFLRRTGKTQCGLINALCTPQCFLCSASARDVIKPPRVAAPCQTCPALLPMNYFAPSRRSVGVDPRLHSSVNSDPRVGSCRGLPTSCSSSAPSSKCCGGL